MVKNITLHNIRKIDTNKDGNITPYEIQRFWSTSKNLNVHPDKHMIIQYVIEPAFMDGVKEIETSEFISSLSNPTKDHSIIMNVTNTIQGWM